MYRSTPFFILTAAAIVTAAVLSGCSDDLPTEIQRPRTPNFELEDLDGETFRLSNHQGEVVVLQFFQVDCRVCQEETETLNTLYEDLADSGLVVVAIPVQSGQKESVEAFVDEHDVQYRVLLDEHGIVAPAYGVRRTPTTYLIDREGWIVRSFTGATSEEEFRDMLRPLLSLQDSS